MSDEDLRAAREGLRAAIDDSILKDLELLLSSSATSYRTKVFATLIATGRLKLKIAVPSMGSGIYHEKKGLFEDQKGNAVSFIGSANETLSAWSTTGNFESIEVFCSWKGHDPAERVIEHSDYLANLWDNQIPGVNVTDLPETVTAVLRDTAFRSIEEIDNQLLEPPKARRTVLRHQKEALDEWERQGKRGILEHATGSGKTFTALTAMRSHLEAGGNVLVLVPSTLLLQQWNSEVLLELEGCTVMCAGGGHTDWARPFVLEAMTSAESGLGQRVIIATVQTASRDEFLHRIRGGTHLMVVGDEVHTTGSRQFSKVFSIDSGPRLGLSATPKRYGDPEGTAAIQAYFGKVVQPPFTLRNAIAEDRLVPYEYWPHPVNLDSEEQREWKKFTQRIGAAIGGANSDILGDEARLLLIQRARIAKKAEGKVPLAAAVLKRHFTAGQKWLVYCEDSDQLADVMAKLRGVGIEPIEYHTGQGGSMSANLKWFTDHGGVLVSIRCLDEGVDIPSISHALILASSQNPRQFIQRRGRVLRKSPGKSVAVVHDAIVLPGVAPAANLTALADAEFSRAVEFAQGAINNSAYLELIDWAGRYGITLSPAGTDFEDEPETGEG